MLNLKDCMPEYQVLAKRFQKENNKQLRPKSNYALLLLLPSVLGVIKSPHLGFFRSVALPNTEDNLTIYFLSE